MRRWENRAGVKERDIRLSCEIQEECSFKSEHVEKTVSDAKKAISREKVNISMLSSSPFSKLT